MLGFRSTAGFGSTRYTHNHEVYGDLIFSVDLGAGRATPHAKNFVQEGTYFYTFIVLKMGLFGLWHRYGGLIQFTESVPSLEWAKAQAQTQHSLNKSVRDEAYEALTHEQRMQQTYRNMENAFSGSGKKIQSYEQFKAELTGARATTHQKTSLSTQLQEEEFEVLRQTKKYKDAPRAVQLAMERDLIFSFRLDEDRLKP